ncbi:S8 family serine peptidase [Cryptosporangium minutisporangium]|uniref:S8 family serine peptidase n=1 Tax=Cryptosporangium minutisporangium TaxID=113569 RepID=UPI0031EEA1AB
MRAILLLGVSLLLVTIGARPANAETLDDAQWYLRSLQVAKAHQLSNGAGVIVAVVDTGVDAGHPDLRGRILPGAVFGIPGSTDPTVDPDGHGTAMASLIVGKGPAGDHALGLAPAAQVLPVRTGDYSPDIAAGIRWAADHGAKIINCSLGTHADDAYLRAAVDYAHQRGVLVIAGAGNQPRDTTMLYPAALPGVLAVTATNQTGQIAAVSTTGPGAVLAAPGQGIGTATSRLHAKAGYTIGDGTSASTAVVSGAAALLWSRFPDLTAGGVIQRLITTADDAGTPGRDPLYGFGRLDLIEALTADVPPVTHNPLVSRAQPTTPPTNADVAAARRFESASRPAALTSYGPGIGVVLVVGIALFLVVRSVRRIRRPASFAGPPAADPRQQPPAGLGVSVPPAEMPQLNSPAAAELLRLCAHLDPDLIDVQLLLSRPELLDTPLTSQLARAARSDHEREDTIAALIDSGSVTRRDERRIRMSPRVAQAALHELASKSGLPGRGRKREAWARHAVDVILGLLPTEPWRRENWPATALLVVHATTAVEHATSSGAKTHQDAEVLLRVGTYHSARGDYDAARRVLRRALVTYEAALGPNHPDVAHTLMNLGLVHHGLADAAASGAVFARAIGIFDGSYGPEHPYTVRAKSLASAPDAASSGQVWRSDVERAVGTPPAG